MSRANKPCEPWCRSVAHGTRGYCSKACRNRAEREGTAEDRPGRLLVVGGIRVPEWAPLYDDPPAADAGEAIAPAAKVSA